MLSNETSVESGCAFSGALHPVAILAGQSLALLPSWLSIGALGGFALPTVTQLRTGALQAIGEHKPGTSPLLHLGAVEHPMHDPQCYALVHTALMMRDMQMSVDDFAFAMQVHSIPRQAVAPRSGPVSVLLHRLHQVAWQWVANTVFLDHQSIPCDVLHCSVQELKDRLCRAWQAKPALWCSGIADGLQA